MRGTVLTSWQPRQYEEPVTATTLDALAELGATHVGVISTWYVSDLADVSPSADADRTPTEASVRHVLREARRRGLRTVLKPHVDVADDTWRGLLEPEDPADWFAAYTDFIVRFATVAAEEEVDLFVVGTEFRSLSTREDDWRAVVEAVREAYGGQVTYAANWDEYDQIRWWDAVDLIGVDAYFPLTDDLDPEPAELARAWNGIAAELSALAARESLPVLVTEFGYQARDGANITPWWAPTEEADEAEQALCLDVAFGAMAEAPGLAGSMLWKTFYDPAVDEDDFDVLGRPAEVVVREAWSR